MKDVLMNPELIKSMLNKGGVSDLARSIEQKAALKDGTITRPENSLGSGDMKIQEALSKKLLPERKELQHRPEDLQAQKTDATNAHEKQRETKNLTPNEGKEEFYPKIRDALESQGYKYYDGDEDIKGKTRAHRSKPDYIAIKDDQIIIGETKSPNEPPTSSSWRQVQKNDSQEFAKVRTDIADREKSGQLDPKVGGHIIIIDGQINDYMKKMGAIYDSPFDISGKKIMGGYSSPASEAKNIEEALNKCGKNDFEKIDTGNGAVTYKFPL